MATFRVIKAECLGCKKEFETIDAMESKRLHILWGGMYAPLCDDCTDKMLQTIGTTRDTIISDWSKINN